MTENINTRQINGTQGKPAESAAKLEFYTTKDVAEMLGCSIPTARQLFYRKDFPTLKVGKNLKVCKSAFEKWASERRV